ncbi:GTPase [Methylomarinovum tepidoasis]|uniref:GTPase Era n=1 Tax=Methylomarinovum tepidoasis TaxID=2840183 RepID=A0AAU9CYM8_9GAMM|nr:GTPase Era [Methylomarinovum sp. IN45]BCX89144.1 GTPase [Methylomarinovum sp. IN45]
MKTGYVALIGRPNVGKSTLLNRLLGQKLSIVSRKPQTTRHRILGIKTTAEFQAVYVDTPGIHQGESRALNRYLNKAAASALVGVDVVVWLIDAKGFRKDDALVFEKLKAVKAPVILAINKIDKVRDKKTLLPLIAKAERRYPFAAIVPVSALAGDNVEALEQAIVTHLPEGPPIYPEDQITDKPERFFAAEIIREKLLYYLGDEIPHRLTVEIDQFKEENGLTSIYAVIWVERESQKPIVIGRHGELLKKVGQQARLELEDFLDRKVYLNLWVKVKKGWSDDERLLKQLGYAD